jgi:hypothetical protein
MVFPLTALTDSGQREQVPKTSEPEHCEKRLFTTHTQVSAQTVRTRIGRADEEEGRNKKGLVEGFDRGTTLTKLAMHWRNMPPPFLLDG